MIGGGSSRCRRAAPHAGGLLSPRLCTDAIGQATFSPEDFADFVDDEDEEEDDEEEAALLSPDEEDEDLSPLPALSPLDDFSPLEEDEDESADPDAAEDDAGSEAVDPFRLSVR